MGIDDVMTNLFAPIVQVGLIIGLAEVVKKMGLETRFIPIFDVVLGMICGILVYGVSLGYGFLRGVLIGIALGLEACGIFSSYKNVFKNWLSDY